MVRKKLAMAVLALSALQADVASALGLGNVSVRSNLNQPLNAEIRLLDTGDLDPTQIKIELASTDDFDRAGVDRDYFLSNLRFAVELDGRGGGVVRITTREPVVEPYLNFIIETRWPSGRLLREYAVLLDLPTFSEGASVPFVPAGSSGLATVQQSQQQSLQQPARSAAPAAAPAGDWSMPGGGPGEYRVQQSDTMGRIAARLRPASDVSVEQTMLAIQRANPQAFIRNNVNLVKAGYILRVPSADEMRSLSAGEAAQQVAAQNQAWRSGETYAPGSADTAAAPQLDARSSTATTEEGGYREQARLSIATPGDSTRDVAGEGAAASGAGSEALRGELAAAQEGLESARRDNSELQSRLDDMERQVATLNRLISLKDEQLSALQAQGQQQMAAAAEQPAADVETAPETVEPSAEVETDPAAQVDATAQVEEQATVVDEAATEAADTAAEVADATTDAAPVAEAPAETPPAPKPAAKPGLVDQLTANPLVPAAGAGLLALILAGVLLARRRKAAEQEQQALTDLSFDFEPAATEEEPVVAPDLDGALISDDKVAPADDFTKPAAEAPAQRVRSETGDAIAEADIYIAYGRYQQAVDLLKGAIEAEPQRSDLRVKLLEVYIEMRDREAFRRQFADLQGLGDEGAVVQVKEMLSSVDGVSGWLDDMPASSSSSSAFAPVATAAAAAAVAAATYEEPATRFEPEPEFEQELALDDDLAGGELDLDLGDDFADGELALDDLAAVEEPADSGSLSLNELSELSGLEPVAQPLQTFSESASTAADTFESTLESGTDEGLELDLNEDELDLALDGMGGEGDGLEDLALDFADGVAAPVAASDEFDLSSLDAPAGEAMELDAEFDLPMSGSNDLQPNDSQLGDGGADLETTTFGSLDNLDLALDNVDDKPAAVEPGSFESAPFETQPFEAEPFAPQSFEQTEPLAAADAFASDEFSADSVTAQSVTEAPVLAAGEDEFDFLADADEVATKLDLARAYIDMGDTDGARDILGEVMQEGTEAQRQDASALLSRIG